MPKPIWIATLTAAVLVLGGCGGDDDPEPRAEESSETPTESDTPTPSDSPTTDDTPKPTKKTSKTPEETLPPEPLGDCPMLGDDAVTKVFGRPMGVLTASPELCVFTPTEGMTDSSVTINLGTGGNAAAARGKCKGKVTEVEAGDDAFVCKAGPGVQGYVFKGGDSVVLDVVFDNDQKALAAAAELLPSVFFS
ncbi:hypothetical protein [Nocardioides speluncae]|uniref:hypothetical protein n=1 Tax=Nocardioides speluncae TaxID=2670337 RepID=UPI000D69746A|nr:hypothetical protein [Nocardioides speluncae]